MGKQLPSSSSELIPSQEGAEMAAIVSHVVGKAQGKLADALRLAKDYAGENGMDALAIQRAVAAHINRARSLELLQGQRESGDAFDEGMKRADDKRRMYDTAREEIFAPVFSKDELANRRAALARETRDKNSIPVPFKVVHAHGRGH